MTPQQLMRKIKGLPERAPHTDALEKQLLKKPQWYGSQKEHWLGWLNEYDGPGFYGRKFFGRDAAYAYNHCGCPPMILWLGEAAGIDKKIVKRARSAASREEGTFSSKCAIIRDYIPWCEIEGLL